MFSISNGVYCLRKITLHGILSNDTMEATNKVSPANDYAVAKALNGQINGIIAFMYMAGAHDLAKDHQVDELNRAYILLTHELEQIYARNPELLAIKPDPIWRRFDVLKNYNWDIKDYIDDTDDTGHAHTLRVERLCIIAGVDNPSYTPEQQKLVKSADAVAREYAQKLVRASEDMQANKANNWQIPEYRLTYKPDGSVLINDVLKLKKAHAGSSTERLLEQALKSPGTLFKPDIGQTSRNLSTILSSAGFTKELRELFFPTISNSKGIVFRPAVTRQQADDENIDTSELDIRLKELGSETEPKSS